MTIFILPAFTIVCWTVEVNTVQVGETYTNISLLRMTGNTCSDALEYICVLQMATLVTLSEAGSC